ncbi:sugar nucleotidyltransferase [Bradyrhizobium sp. ISRA442]|uniref:sugar nucleotidyltransferase n=1 Tax=Bradyrhizobium sp. ISRA442 TaxID=2866197 RepID=UPI004049D782
MKGIILAGGTGSRLWPITRGVSKQLLAVYDKPMIYYPLTTLMLAASVRSCSSRIPTKRCSFKPYWETVQDGAFSSSQLRRAATSNVGAVTFAYWVREPSQYGVVDFDPDGGVRAIIEKPKNPPSNFAVTGLYFYDEQVADIAATLKPSPRGELEITDVNNHYLRQGRLMVEKLGRGFAWLDTGSPESLLQASEFMATVEARQGLKIASPEEIAWRQGWIDDSQLEGLAADFKGNTYGQYLFSLLAGR